MSKPRKTARRYAAHANGDGAQGEVRVAIYLRISTDEEHQPFSLEGQDHRLRAFIESQPGWTLARAPYVDQMSGAKIERPALQKALRDAALGLYDVLLVYRVDRFARKLSVLVELLEQLEKCGVAFRSATEPIDTSTPTGRMLVQLLGVFAEFERETIIDRVIAGMERKAARGEWTVGRYPFGYTVPEKRKGDDSPDYLVVDETNAPLVPVIFDLYVRKRMGAHAVANWLNDNGHRTKAGRLWAHTAVLDVLRNRAYLGEVYFRGVWHLAPHPPLIDADLFAKAQELLAERGEDYSRRTAHVSDYLLSGLVKCSKCGCHYTGTVAHGRSNTYRYYTCFSRQRYGTRRCDADRLPADALDAAVLDALLATYERHDLFDQAVNAAAAHADDSRELLAAELEATEAKIVKAEDAIERYLRAFEDKTMPEAQCGERVRKLGRELAELRARRDELAETLEDGAVVPPSPEVLAELRGRIAEAIDTGTDAERKLLLQALVHEVKVTSREHIEPFFRVPETADASAVRAVSGLVGRRGLEPLTPCASCKCATSCANGPWRGRLAVVAGRTTGQWQRPSPSSLNVPPGTGTNRQR
jgi:site-specific DNA recombinase